MTSRRRLKRTVPSNSRTPFVADPNDVLQVNITTCGGSACPAQVCPAQGFSRMCPAARMYPRVCAETRPFLQPNRRVTSIRLSADTYVMKRRQIRASGLGHLVGWPRSHAASVTEGYMPVGCENKAQHTRLPCSGDLAEQRLQQGRRLVGGRRNRV